VARSPATVAGILGVDPDALLSALPVGVTIQDRSGRVVYANRAAAELSGFPSPQALVAATPEELRDSFEFRTESGDPLPLGRLPGREVLAGQEPAELLTRVRLRAVPTERWRIVTAFPLRDEAGQVAFAVNVFRDVSEQRMVEKRLTTQYTLTRILAEGRTLAETAPRILETVGQGLDWDAGNLWEVDEPAGVLKLAEGWHRPDRKLRRFLDLCRETTFRPEIGLPGRVWSSGTPAWVSDVQTDRNFPRSPGAVRAGLRGAFAFPVLRAEEVVGVVEFFSHEVREPDPDLLRMMGAVGTQIGQFVERLRAQEDQRFLVEATDVLAGSLEYERTLSDVAALSVPRLADVCIVYMAEPDGEIRRVAVKEAATLRPRMSRRLARQFPMDPQAAEGIPKVLRTGRPEFHAVATPELLAADVRDPERLVAVIEPMGVLSWIAVPLRARGRTFGAISLISAGSGRRFDAADLALAEELARRAALAVDNARLFREAEEAHERMAYLAEVSRSLAASLNYRRTLAKVARLTVPRLADWCVIDMLEDDGSIRLLSVAHADPEKVRLARRLRRRYPPEAEAPGGVPAVIKTGKPELHPHIPEELLLRAARDEEHLRLLRQLNLRSLMIVPLTARGRTVGAITMVAAESGRRFDEEDLRLAQEVGARAGVAVDNARLYEDRVSVARTLQRTLLPPQLPAVPGVELAATYRSAGRGEDIGGDFYDVFSLADDDWVLVIGDVCGRGIQAASLTGLARHTIRATALKGYGPAETLDALNEVIRREESESGFCTVAFTRLRLDSAGAEVTVACGGHPPPLRLRANGAVEQIGAPGTLIGVLPEVDAREQTVRLEPGETVLLYTDGVTDQRADHQLFGEARLRRLLRRSVGDDARTVVDRITEALEAFAVEPARDDVALLAFRLRPG
jgi:serine phosphatase RsbU (regulator of sigma subunit)